MYQDQNQQEMLKRLLQGGMRSNVPGLEWWRAIMQNQAPLQNVFKFNINRPMQSGGMPLGGMGGMIRGGGMPGTGGMGGVLPAPGRTINIGDIIRNLPSGGLPPGIPGGGLPNRRPML